MAITSSAPGIPKVIKITITSGVKGQAITIRNRNNGDIIHTTLSDTAKAMVDLQNFANNYTAGHVIDISVAGEKVGQNSLTTSGNEIQTVTIGTASIGTTHTRGI